MPSLCSTRGAVKPGVSLLDVEAGQMALGFDGLRARVGHRKHRDHGGDVTLADEALLAVEGSSSCRRGTALVRRLAASEPAPDSVSPKAASFLPAARSGSQRCFCSAVPPWISGNADSSWTHMITPGRGVGAAQLLDRDQHGDHVAAEAAVLGRVWQCEDVLAGE